MGIMSALDNMSGDQFGGDDVLDPSAIYSPGHTFGDGQGQDNSWTAQVTGIRPNRAPYQQPADGLNDDENDPDSAEKPGNGPAKKTPKFATTDPYAVVGHVSSQLQTVRPSNG
jgi:hypothetical protein